jgi:hypothetical protein
MNLYSAIITLSELNGFDASVAFERGFNNGWAAKQANI